MEAGAIHLDMARALEAVGKQFYVNTEIGSLTAGSAACCGTKDASMPGEYGMVGSYVTGVRVIMPDGTDQAFSDADDPAMMQLIRSSYGTFGIVHEVTFRIRALRHVKVRHETFTIGDFVSRLDGLTARNESMMYYIFPFEDRITSSSAHISPICPLHPTAPAGSCAIWDGAISHRAWRTRTVSCPRCSATNC